MRVEARCFSSESQLRNASLNKQQLMVRHVFLKCLLLVLVIVLPSLAAWSDVLVPSPYALSRAEWTVAIAEKLRDRTLGFVIPCIAIALYAFALLILLRRKRVTAMLWLAYGSPFLLIPVFPICCRIGGGFAEICAISVFALIVVSWASALVFFLCKRMFCDAGRLFVLVPILVPILLIGALWVDARLLSGSSVSESVSVATFQGPPVEVETGETYDEYVKRANRIIYHHCTKCDNPMKEYARGYWLCPNCDKGVMSCSKCGVQIRLAWQDRVIWKCPNCASSIHDMPSADSPVQQSNRHDTLVFVLCMVVFAACGARLVYLIRRKKKESNENAG